MSASLHLFPDLPRNPRKPRPVKAPSLPSWMIGERAMRDWGVRRAGGRLVKKTALLWREVVSYDGEEYTAQMIGLSPRLKIEISDMHFSLGAKHYYAKVHMPGIGWIRKSDGCWVLRHGLGRFLDVVEMTQKLTQKEITSDPERYGRGWKAGDDYCGFNTAKEALNAAQKWIAEFTSGFAVEVDAEGYDID